MPDMTRALSSRGLSPAAYGCGLLILVNVGRLPELVPPLSGLHLGKIGMLLGVAALFLSKNKSPAAVFSTPLGRRVLILSILAIVSVSYSVWPSQSLRFLSQGYLVVAVLFYLVAKTITSIREFRFLTWSLILSALILSLVTVQQQWSGRLAGESAYDQNDLAMVLVTLFPLVVAQGYVSKSWGRLIAGAVGLLALMTIMLTGSRGGYVGLAAVAGYFIVSQEKAPGLKRIIMRGTAVVIALIGLWIIAPDTQKERVASFGNLEQDYNIDDEAGRLKIWGRGLTLMMTRPHGVGVGAFPHAEGALGGRYMTAHNAMIQVGSELGVLGLIVFISFYLCARRTLSGTLREVMLLPEEDRGESSKKGEIRAYVVGVKGAFLGFFVTSFFLSAGYAGIFYVLLGLTVSVESIVQNHAILAHPRSGA